MSHAESLHELHRAAGATAALVSFTDGLRYDALSDEVRHYARRHLLDTVGVMIAGAGAEVVMRAERMLEPIRPPGSVPVPGRARRADLLDAAFLGGTAAHGIELDDGYTIGSVHAGCAVVPVLLALGVTQKSSGKALLEAMVAGYETAIAIGRACHPDLRQRGFHPTGAVSVFGAAAASAKLRKLQATQLANAFGIAASASAGLFAFVNGGADIKRLHAGHAAREGLQAALLAEQNVEGPPNVIEARDGFMQALVFGSGKARAIELPPARAFGITECYIKPNPCCRHIQPAVEALIAILEDEKIAAEDVERVETETYRIAAAHAGTGFDDYASAQLSFPYLMALALKFRAIKVEHFDDAVRGDPQLADLAGRLVVSAPPEIERLYPKLRPARVTVTTKNGKTFTRQADDALGSRLVPLSDDGLAGKFHGLVAPVLGEGRAKQLAQSLWAIDGIDDVSALVESMAKS